MSLNDTPNANRFHIGFFGQRNAGKSSLVNAILGQDHSVVSDTPGTTTDPVNKAMELLPIGPVLLTDTAGLDDSGSLGEKRIGKTYEILRKADLAVLVADGVKGLSEDDRSLIRQFESRNLPHLTVFTKLDLLSAAPPEREGELYVSCRDGTNIRKLKDMLGAVAADHKKETTIVSDLLQSGDTVILVVPIDKAAPKGRLILPQQMVIRDLLDGGMIPLVCKETELEKALSSLQSKPAMVITDSQVFGKVAALLPDDLPLTSFSVLMARFKGTLEQSLEGADRLDHLTDGARILIAEGCTHHRQCGDIGTEKLPALIRSYTGIFPDFSYTSGTGYPSDLSSYDLIIHCGGCMLGEKEMLYRMQHAMDAHIPFTNYGIAIAKMNGILSRICF